MPPENTTPQPLQSLTLDDPRIPDAVRVAAHSALAAGHKVHILETTGNPLLPTRLYLDLWVPWESEHGRAIKALGGNDTAMDCCRAMMDEGEQSVCWYEPMPETPAMFRLVRVEDATGVSGTGHVADGIVWHDGTCAVRWRTEHRSTTVYDSLDVVRKIHGHGGRTVVEWYPEMWRTPKGSVCEVFRGGGAQFGAGGHLG